MVQSPLLNFHRFVWNEFRADSSSMLQEVILCSFTRCNTHTIVWKMFLWFGMTNGDYLWGGGGGGGGPGC